MLSEKIKAMAVELGYTACGIIPAATFDELTMCVRCTTIVLQHSVEE